MDSDGFLAGLGLKLVNVVCGAVAAFAALRFFEGLGLWDKWLTFLGGWALAAWGAPPLAEALELPIKVEIGIVLLLGLFGMSAAAELVKVVRDTDWSGILRAVLGRKP